MPAGPLEAVVLLGLVFLFYHDALRGGWMHDDPRLLYAGVKNGLLAHFWNPGCWREISTSLLMPWLVFSLGLDQVLFGLTQVWPFYLHHLLSLAAVAVLGVRLASAFFPRWVCWCVVVFFLLLEPAEQSAHLLMTRHYIEGMGFVLGAALCWRRATERDDMKFAVVGALLYLLAMTAKETFAPALVFFPMVGKSGRAFSPRLGWPFVLAAGLYVLWRGWMLGWGHLFTGYGDASGGGAFDAASAAGMFTGQSMIAGIVGIFLAGVVLCRAFACRSWRAAYGAAALVLVTWLTLAPVQGMLAPRYFLLPAAGWCVWVGAGMAGLAGRDGKVWLRVVAVAALLVPPAMGLPERLQQRWDGEASFYRAVSPFVLEQENSEAMLVTPHGSAMYYHNLRQLRKELLHGDGPWVCGDRCVCRPEGVQRVYAWRDGAIVREADGYGMHACGDQESLTVEVEHDRNARSLAWRFGPYEGGTYQFSGASGGDVVTGHYRELPREGRIPLNLYEPLRFVIRFRDQAGSLVYSDVLMLDPSQADEEGQTVLYWERVSDE